MTSSFLLASLELHLRCHYFNYVKLFPSPFYLSPANSKTRQFLPSSHCESKLPGSISSVYLQGYRDFLKTRTYELDSQSSCFSWQNKSYFPLLLFVLMEFLSSALKVDDQIEPEKLTNLNKRFS